MPGRAGRCPREAASPERCPPRAAWLKGRLSSVSSLTLLVRKSPRLSVGVASLTAEGGCFWIGIGAPTSFSDSPLAVLLWTLWSSAAEPCPCLSQTEVVPWIEIALDYSPSSRQPAGPEVWRKESFLSGSGPDAEGPPICSQASPVLMATPW